MRTTNENAFWRSGSLIAASSFGAAGVAFLVNLMMARALGPGPRGNVAFLLQISYFVVPLATLGREREILREGLSRSPFATGGYVLGVVAVSCISLSPSLGIDGVLVSGISLCGAMLALLRATAIHDGTARPFLTLFGIQQLIILSLSVCLFKFDVKDWRLWAVTYAATSLVYLWTEARSVFRRDSLSFTKSSLTLMPGVFAALIVTRLDRLVLPILSGPYELGLYVTVATATEPVFWVSQLIADRRSSRLRRRPQGYARDAKIFAAASAAIGASLWFVLVPLFGQAFAEARSLIPPLSVGGFALAMYRQQIARLLGGFRPVLATRAEFLTAIVAILTYPIAIARFDAQGAAYASVVTYGLGFVMALRLQGKKGGYQ